MSSYPAMSSGYTGSSMNQRSYFATLWQTRIAVAASYALLTSTPISMSGPISSRIALMTAMSAFGPPDGADRPICTLIALCPRSTAPRASFAIAGMSVVYTLEP